jgi:hypothetical protein
MGKKEGYKAVLKTHLEDYLKHGESDGLKEVVEANSSLPGPRVNLEFASAFADVITESVEASADLLWVLCNEWIKLTPEEAPSNDPKEFIPFCGTLGLGAIGAESEDYYGEALPVLRRLSRDRRWRMREGVRMGLQKLLRRYPEKTLDAWQNWIQEGDPLEVRAVIASLSTPDLLEDQDLADKALQFHSDIVKQIGLVQDRKTKPFRVLRKALGYTLSILICAQPEAGWGLMDELIHSKDPDLHWIARSNLKKRRLLRSYPEETETRLQAL